ncbi:hypothetical protein MPSEU_000534900 [Mayamaea pseudoterrestris]|nr:hypothetical protein MPSEU_000534900 [Mayamaea pseudoterrestris]
MGWFNDESDESDDGETQRKGKNKASLLDWMIDDAEDERQTLQHSTNGTEHAINQDDDPLEAYMNNLGEIGATNTPQNAASSSERLDLVAEADEATEHWNEDTTGSSGTNTHDFLPATILKTPLPFDMEHIQKVFYTPTSMTGSQGRDWREKHQVSCTGAACDPMLDFQSLLQVFPSALVTLLSQTYQQFTLVQAQALPVLLSGKDAVITAHTGQGKTLSYLLPALAHINNQPNESIRIQQQQESMNISKASRQKALVLVPTRELALQVHQQAQPFLKILGLAGKAVIGGGGGASSSASSASSTSKYHLQLELQRDDHYSLIVATPARLIDVLSGFKKSQPDYLASISFCVLDEADKILSMGFAVQVDTILHRLPRNRQTVLLSATMGHRVERVAQQWLQPHHVRISVGRTGEASQNVEQHVMVLPDVAAKRQFLLSMLETLTSIGRTLVFCATREGCEALGQVIAKGLPDIPFVTLHGDKHQSDRNAALKAFAKKDVNLMIATDVAGRGLDVPDVMTVINFDPAKNLDAHVHRCGRAGRLRDNQQQVGTAYALLTKRDSGFARVLRNAFEREGREISTELAALAGSSFETPRQNTGRMSQAGIGFSRNSSSTGTTAPPQKRSRFK